MPSGKNGRTRRSKASWLSRRLKSTSRCSKTLRTGATLADYLPNSTQRLNSIKTSNGKMPKMARISSRSAQVGALLETSTTLHLNNNTAPSSPAPQPSKASTDSCRLFRFWIRNRATILHSARAMRSHRECPRRDKLLPTQATAGLWTRTSKSP